MKKIKRIVVHHSASEWGNANEIDHWHKSRGWKEIGYHFVIQNGYPTAEDKIMRRRWNPLIGQIECGRHIDLDDWIEENEIGAHCLSLNKESIGICLIHDKGEKYKLKMLISLSRMCHFLVRHFEELNYNDIIGHYEVDSKKPNCPGINMPRFRKLLKLEKPFLSFSSMGWIYRSLIDEELT